MHPRQSVASMNIFGTTTTVAPTLYLTVDSHTNAESMVSLIGVLPAELLIEIFTYCVANEGLAPLKLRKVSRWWREVADTSPLLWQTLVLGDANQKTFTERQAELWTRRSQPLPYDIILNVEDPDYILPLLSPLLPSVDRWRSLRLSANPDEELISKNLKALLTPDTLTHLHICLHDYDQGDFDDDSPRVALFPLSPDPTSNYALTLWTASLPSPWLLPRLRFVHVTITEGGLVGIHIQPKCILNFLTACPELESFWFVGSPHDNPSVGDPPVINLPNLITLHLKSTCFVRVLLSSLNTPRLEKLYLSHSNVDFELPGEYHDDGDSDDEAQDYSQSPSSDQATGMGLRKLINRCSPPIRVLIMDFCDMRTKDFRIVFDKLHLLEDFHIVASDMSDKVINLLRPIRPTPSSEEIDAYIRLPHLRKLRLSNCQRLSGKAIAKSVSDRVRWTDVYSPDYTLVDVDIIGCEGFTSRDRSLLSTYLGNRLQS